VPPPLTALPPDHRLVAPLLEAGLADALVRRCVGRPALELATGGGGGEEGEAAAAAAAAENARVLRAALEAVLLRPAGHPEFGLSSVELRREGMLGAKARNASRNVALQVRTLSRRTQERALVG
jgi:hypothetical protein